MSKFKGRTLATIEKLKIPTCMDCGKKLRRSDASHCDDCLTHIIENHEEEPDEDEQLRYADVIKNV